MALFKANRFSSPSPAETAGQPIKAAAVAGAMDAIQNQSGGCRLEAGQALTLQARQAGSLRVAQGRLWVTFSNAAQDERVRAGDHFLMPGDSLALAAGDTVVMESWAVGQGASAWVCWQPAPVPSLMPVLRCAYPSRGPAFAFSQ